MKLIGFDQAKAKAVLKKLLKVYENNWEYIEAENYRLLADSILDDKESVDPEVNETDAAASVARKVSRKRLRHRPEDSDHFPLEVEASGETSPQRPKLVRSPEDHPTNFRGKMIKPVEAQCPHDGEGSSSSSHTIRENELIREKAPQNSHNCQELSLISGRVVPRMTRSSNPPNVPYFEKGKSNSLVMQERDKHQPCGTSGNLICHKEPKMEPDTEFPRDIVAVAFSSNPDMSVDEVPCYISDNYVPLALPSPHGTPSGTAANHGTAQKGDFLWANASTGLTGANSEDAPINENEKCVKVLVQKEITKDHSVSAPHPLLDENDIAKGEEIVRISLINEFTSEKFPAYFHYIARNAVYQNAHVNFSLARIDDEDCCLNCGEFAYTMDGLLKAEFLNECISMNRDPYKRHHIYCKDCPIEKSKNEHTPEACKGHLVRKFIKECWIKCGCSKQCGNRVVQRGISRNLQVFFVADVKGWGLRTLEELPSGAFVCEYVGEILTNIELYDRTIQKTGGARHTYPVILDADWGSEAGLRDEEALCLDATFFGNVGRFLAFFTTRKVEALEELTWDYGIDFDDRSHPIKAFKCLCGSRFCRDRVRSKATRSRASGSK
ncbi:hypothetical protein KFK09_018719 [Dendrobium nobile]|uniref:SET domain-containing protein n=1 Tax=Dendrobium nobile TaxID=94219 RepID=A0A8T3B1Z8_DENNO|nr:hypothetical protein KFK09_018719 [Dendrobium nobile]